MIPAKLLLPDRKRKPVTPIPSELIHFCSECGQEILPIFVHGQWRRRACLCSRIERQRREQQEQEALWKQKALSSTYDWLRPSVASVQTINCYLEKTFANFRGNTQPDAYHTILKFAEMLQGNLVLHGLCGTGKTHLLLAICNFLRDRGIVARFAYASTLIKVYQRSIPEEQARIERILKTTPLAVFDDVDKATESPARMSFYNEIVDARSMAGLPTALSTNEYSLLSVHIGEAAIDRLSKGMMEIQMLGESQRGI